MRNSIVRDADVTRVQLISRCTRVQDGAQSRVDITYAPPNGSFHHLQAAKPTNRPPFRARLIADFSSLRVRALVPAPRPRTEPNARFHAAGVRLRYLHEDAARARAESTLLHAAFEADLCPFRARLIDDFSSLRVQALAPAPRPRTEPNARSHAFVDSLCHLHEDAARARRV